MNYSAPISDDANNGLSKGPLCICNACDEKGGYKLTREAHTHTDSHPLIRCQEPQEKKLSQEEQIVHLRGQVEELTTRMSAMEGLLKETQTHLAKISGETA